ncbi:MAG: CRISPR-associated endonuclease Cas1 [bacterium]|nr:CRISPR-associated endonuclease Cas1 [bacterium]
MHTRLHLHLLQARYWESPYAIETARALIERKNTNMTHLLTRYLSNRERMEMPQARVLRATISVTRAATASLLAAPSRRALMLHEAHAARAYWRSYGMLAGVRDDWRRVHPHASDHWNASLNIGYTILARTIQRTLRAHGLCAGIGVLHAPIEGHEALVYDFEELFRQPVVDSALLPQWSRMHGQPMKPDTVVVRIERRLQERTRYQKEWWRIIAVLDAEVAAYATALRQGMQYVPYQHSWAHWTHVPAQ